MDGELLVRKFRDADLCLTPEALEFLLRMEGKEVEELLEKLKKVRDGPFVTPEVLRKALGLEEKPSKAEGEEGGATGGRAPERGLKELSHGSKPLAAEIDARVEVIKDITGKSYSRGEIRDFLSLFRDRYERLSALLRRRTDFQNPVYIEELGRMEGETVTVIGMVMSKRETSSGHLLIEIEDLTGRAAVWVFKGQRELMQKAGEVVPDEVIGVEGNVRPGDKIPRILARDIVWPDLPTPREPTRADEPVCAVLISDLHVGSKMFLEDVFMRFIKWLRGELGNADHRELAGRTKYVVIAGDVVDGIGIYPKQEEELLIHDIFRQYEEAARLLEQIPDHITIIISPGNHDGVRPSEPQPAISREVGGRLYELNSVMVGNPAWVSLHGVKFLIYHGRSFDDLAATVPGSSRSDISSMMIKLLQKRHMAPVYGGRVAVVPEEKDFLVIEEVPDVFHCGHAHVYGLKSYRSVWAVNSGTFQTMTTYMWERGITPTPGIITVMDLQKNQPKVIRLA